MLEDFTLDEQEPCVQGHFPGAPLVPGAWLLAKIDLCLRTHLPHRRLTGFSKVKFIAPLTPGMETQLHADLTQITEDLQPTSIKVQLRSGSQLILEARAQLL